MSKLRDVEQVSVQGEKTTPSERRVVAVIGVNRYHHWQHLENAVADALAASELFQRLGFEHITAPLVDERATCAAMHSLVADDLRKLGPNDSLVLFYAGHGSTQKHRVGNRFVKAGYLIPVDASDSPDKISTWIDLEMWLRAVSLLPARHILVIIDACHSGIALDPIIKWRDVKTPSHRSIPALARRQSRRIITSALDDQIALDSGPVHGHSLFTGCLIEALTDGIGKNGHRITTGSELGLYIQKRIQTYPRSQQTPDFGAFGFDERGEMVIPLLGHSVCATDAILDSEPQYDNSAMSNDPSEVGTRDSYGVLSLRFPLRRALLLGGATAGIVTLAGMGWLLKRGRDDDTGWKKERQLLGDSVARLAYRLGLFQAPEGGFRGYYLNPPSAYDTGQELTSLMTAAQAMQMKSGIFDPERQNRGIQALEFISRDWKKEQSNTSLPEAYVNFVNHGMTEPYVTAGISWSMIAASKYVALQNNPDARKIIIHLRDILTDRQVHDGAFEYTCNPDNHGYANAYATCMAVWALCEIEQVDLSTEDGQRAREKGVAWLIKQYQSSQSADTTGTTAIASVRGLAEQVFWVIERSRHLDSRKSRTNAEDKIAEMTMKQLIRNCNWGAGAPCSSPNGKINCGLNNKAQFVMLWLPWATLAALSIMDCHPMLQNPSSSDMVALLRRLIAELTAYSLMDEASLFEPAEHLFAMSEVFMGLPNG